MLTFFNYLLLGIKVKDPLKAYQTYFDDGTWMGSALAEAIIISLAVSIIGIIVFYFVIGKTNYKLTKLSSWVVTLLIVGGLTFFITKLNTGIHTKKWGFPPVIENQWKKASQGLEPESEQYISYSNCYSDLKKKCKKGIFSVKPLFALCMYNMLFSVLFFVLFSFLAKKGPTNYAKNIPIK